MNYLLDTDTLIYFLKGSPNVVAQLTQTPQECLYTSIINHTELFFGAHNSLLKQQNLKKIKSFLSHFTVLPFCEEASELFAEHKAFLKTQGTLLADMDLMIASIALKHKMTLVTNNQKHFSRIAHLSLENWYIK